MRLPRQPTLVYGGAACRKGLIPHLSALRSVVCWAVLCGCAAGVAAFARLLLGRGTVVRAQQMFMWDSCPVIVGPIPGSSVELQPFPRSARGKGCDLEAAKTEVSVALLARCRELAVQRLASGWYGSSPQTCTKFSISAPRLRRGFFCALITPVR